MRGVVAIALVLSTVGCDQFFQLDRAEVDAPLVDGEPPLNDIDRDGISDDIDLCLAPKGEGASSDLDGDGVFDAVDSCPYDDQLGIDGDNDGVDDACDPFRNVADRARCLMVFSSVALNTALWQVRPPDSPWSTEPLKLIAEPALTGQTLATVVVSQSIEGKNITTYDAVFQVALRGPGGFGSITMWLRANPGSPSSEDIGCRLVTEPVHNTRFGVVHGSSLLNPTTTMALDAGVQFLRMRGRIVTTGPIGSAASVACHVDTDALAADSTATARLPEGRFGLTVDRWRVELRYLHILDQP